MTRILLQVYREVLRNGKSGEIYKLSRLVILNL